MINLVPPPIKTKIADTLGMLPRVFVGWFTQVYYILTNTNQANSLVSLDENAKLPAIDGSELINIDHLDLANIGTNPHSTIDSHIADVTNNPHAVDKTDVGLGNVVNADTTNADNITSGTLTDNRLTSNVALKNIDNSFSSTQNITGDVIATGKIQGATASFGSATNYAEFEADGTLELIGDATVWEDLNFDPSRASGPAVSLPDFVTINNVTHREFTSANNQLCGGVEEIPHHTKLSETFYPHLHIFLKSGESVGTTGVQFTLYWELRESSGTTFNSVVLSATSAQLTANANKINLYDATGFAGSTELGGQIAVTLARTGGDAGDVIVTTFGIHYKIDTIGSREIASK